VIFFSVGVGSAIVLGIEIRETWFTAVMRDARAFALGTGGSRYAAKSSAITATRTLHRIFLFFMFGADQ